MQRLQLLNEGYRTAEAQGLAAADPHTVGEAVARARVRLLLVDADRILPGTLDADGHLTVASAETPGVDDLFDDMAERVLRTGGEVVVVPSDRMPTATGVAAVFRY
jgi:hypothetical protein